MRLCQISKLIVYRVHDNIDFVKAFDSVHWQIYGSLGLNEFMVAESPECIPIIITDMMFLTVRKIALKAKQLELCSFKVSIYYNNSGNP